MSRNTTKGIDGKKTKKRDWFVFGLLVSIILETKCPELTKSIQKGKIVNTMIRIDH